MPSMARIPYFLQHLARVFFKHTYEQQEELGTVEAEHLV